MNVRPYLNKKKTCHIYSFGKTTSKNIITYKLTRALCKPILFVLSSVFPIFIINPINNATPTNSNTKPLPIRIFQLTGDASAQLRKGLKIEFDISLLDFHTLITSFHIGKNIVNIHINVISYSKS